MCRLDQPVIVRRPKPNTVTKIYLHSNFILTTSGCLMNAPLFDYLCVSLSHPGPVVCGKPTTISALGRSTRGLLQTAALRVLAVRVQHTRGHTNTLAPLSYRYVLNQITSNRTKPADVPLAPSWAELFLLADDPSGLRVYWADVTEDRSSEVTSPQRAHVSLAVPKCMRCLLRRSSRRAPEGWRCRWQ